MYLLATLLRGKDFDLSTEGKSFLAMWGNVSRKLLMGDSWYSQAITSGSLFLNLALGKNEDSNVCYRGGGGQPNLSGRQRVLHGIIGFPKRSSVIPFL